MLPTFATSEITIAVKRKLETKTILWKALHHLSSSEELFELFQRADSSFRLELRRPTARKSQFKARSRDDSRAGTTFGAVTLTNCALWRAVEAHSPRGQPAKVGRISSKGIPIMVSRLSTPKRRPIFSIKIAFWSTDCVLRPKRQVCSPLLNDSDVF